MQFSYEDTEQEIDNFTLASFLNAKVNDHIYE